MNSFRKTTFLAALAAGAVVTTTVSHAESYALIMGISAYPQQPLAGVVKDMDSASRIATALGIRPENMMIKKDAELSAAGIREAMEGFARKLKPGDRAFVYYSGHGTSETGAGGQCVQSLVGQDLNLVSKREFQSELDAIGRVASNTIVMLDSCFSGGVLAGAKPGTRGDDSGGELQPKYFSAKMSQAGDACSEGVNYQSKSRGNDAASRTDKRFYLLAAASDKEYAIDGGRVRGGFATSSFLACLDEGSSIDTNGDGVVSFTEVKQCAQGRVNGMIKAPYTGQTLVESGNLEWSSTPILSAPANMPTHPQSASRPPVSSAAGIDSRKLLDTIVRSADTSQVVSLSSAKPAYKIGQDYLDLAITSSKSGYVSLLSVGSSGRIFQLFPNGADQDNRIRARETLHIPREHWKLPSKGPAGSNRFLAIVTTQPFVFSDMGVPVAGRYQVFEPTAANAQRIVNVLNTPSPNCGKAPQRDFDSIEVNACNTGYGAALVDVREVN